MEFAAKNQERLAIDYELGRTASLFEVWEACLCVTRLADGWPSKGYRD